MTSPPKPRPRVTPDNREFWAGCAAGELRLPHCAECRCAHYPPGPVCPFCFCETLDWRPVSGRGAISAWTRIHQPWLAAFQHELPYNVIQVELDEGPRLTANLASGQAEDLRVGRRVRVVFDRIDDDLTMPRFVTDET